MDAHEVGLVIPGQGDPGRPVRFIADDEIEIVDTEGLGVGHRGQGLVGGEDHR